MRHLGFFRLAMIVKTLYREALAPTLNQISCMTANKIGTTAR